MKIEAYARGATIFEQGLALTSAAPQFVLALIVVFAPTRVWLAPQFFTLSTFSYESIYGATKFAAACQTPTAWRRCHSRLQFRFQALAEGLRKGMNLHYSSCFQLCARICERPPKVLGRVANRDYNSYFTYTQKTWLTGLAAL